MKLLLLLLSRQRNKRRLDAKWADRGGDETDTKEIIGDANYACNMKIYPRMKSRIYGPAKAEWVVRMVDARHVSISNAMGKEKEGRT